MLSHGSTQHWLGVLKAKLMQRLDGVDVIAEVKGALLAPEVLANYSAVLGSFCGNLRRTDNEDDDAGLTVPVLMA